MLTYKLCCTLCKKTFEERESWQKHLIASDHQKIASLEISGWDKNQKKCALVAFASCPIMTCALGLLKYIAMEVDMVTNFFCTVQPHVGILQFKNRNKLTEIITKLKDCAFKVEINGEQVQFREAINFMELEWKHLIANQKVNLKVIEKRKYTSQPDLADSKVVKRSKRRGQDSPQSSSTRPRSRLQTQFKCLLQNVKIPDADVSLAHNLVTSLRKMFRLKYPDCELYLFRNWNLQLKNVHSNELLIGVDFNGHGENLSCQLKDAEAILETGNAEKVLQIQKLDQSQFKIKSTQHILYYVHKPTNLKFALVFNRWIFKEIHTCRLLEHLCSFDKRVKPLFTMISFWSISNSVHLSNDSQYLNFQQHCTPEPAALEWLVMLFLSHRKIIPTPREVGKICVRRRAFNPELCTTWRSSSNVADEDTNKFIAEVLALAADFFNFISKLKAGSWVINLKDGKIIAMQDFLKRKLPLVRRQIGLSLEQIGSLRKGRCLRREPYEKKAIVLVHPIYFCQELPILSSLFYRQACPLFKSTAKRIERFLSSEGSKGVDLMSLLK